ncbi:hypothetical protein ACH4Y0_06425 [Streptomyces sp. NPDC020707]|uniref:hypothetical protein n=1 Tax=Streptomyces TaxID=1883 RepID=UPI0028D36688|nr:hypothetical protein [Streptomyces sp. DSM 40484]
MIETLDFDSEDLEFDYDMRHDAQVLSRICLGNVRTGSIVRQFSPDGEEGCFGPGGVFPYAPQKHAYAHTGLGLADIAAASGRLPRETLPRHGT